MITAGFPSVHASTITQLKNGNLVAAINAVADLMNSYHEFLMIDSLYFLNLFLIHWLNAT